MGLSPELFDRWVEALRSGRYVQGDGKLWDEETDTYCCMGVLCAEAGFDLSAPRPDGVGTYGMHGGVAGYILPDPLHALSVYQREALASMNDAGAPFTEIADFLLCHRTKYVTEEA